MNVLLDTNILIPLEPGSFLDVESQTPIAVRFSRLANRMHIKLCIHPTQTRDIAADRDNDRRQLREILLGKYTILEKPPQISRVVLEAARNPTEGTNEWVDAHLVDAIQNHLVDYLVTEDRGIHKICNRIGVSERCWTLSDAISFCENHIVEPSPPPPAVESKIAYQLNSRDPIFSTLRDKYQFFDDWLEKCKREHRQCWIAQLHDQSNYAALAIVNAENIEALHSHRPNLKLCAFKVSETSPGFRLGELLLHTVYEYSLTNGFRSMFVEVDPCQTDLIKFLIGFGFLKSKRSNLDTGDQTYVKLLSDERVSESLDPLPYYFKFGPRCFKRSGVRIHVVPIQPSYHDRLFPSLAEQQDLFAGNEACGNTIRKAYLCNSNTNRLAPGDIMVFYRSVDKKALTAIGIVERCLRSDNSSELVRYMQDRSVYEPQEVEQKVLEGSALAILFSRIFLDFDPVPYSLLEEAAILKGVPQTIVTIKPEHNQCLLSKIQ